MNRRMRNLVFVLVFFLGLISLVGFGQMSIDEIKNSKAQGYTLDWKEKTSMKYDTIEWDWSDEEPMIEEQLLQPLYIERIV